MNSQWTFSDYYQQYYDCHSTQCQSHLNKPLYHFRPRHHCWRQHNLSKAGNGALTLSGTKHLRRWHNCHWWSVEHQFGGSTPLIPPLATVADLDLGSKIDNTAARVSPCSHHCAKLAGRLDLFGFNQLRYRSRNDYLGQQHRHLERGFQYAHGQRPIGDGGNVYKIQKTGNGTLTLRVDNNFTGGFELGAGQVNLGSANCLGTANVRSTAASLITSAARI